MDTSSEPITEREDVDFYNLIAAERGQPAGWRWFELKCVGELADDGSGVLVTGAVCTAIYSRGKRKGETNWTKRDRSTQRELFISRNEYEKRRMKWQADTGKCVECMGSGQRFASHSIYEGIKYKPCNKCGATGKVAP
jgi:hypothetical protein